MQPSSRWARSWSQSGTRCAPLIIALRATPQEDNDIIPHECGVNSY